MQNNRLKKALLFIGINKNNLSPGKYKNPARKAIMDKTNNIQNLVNNKAQEIIAKNPGLKITSGYNIGKYFYEITLSRKDKDNEDIEKYIIHNCITGPDTTDIEVHKLWDWRSGGYWNRSSKEIIRDIKYC